MRHGRFEQRGSWWGVGALAATGTLAVALPARAGLPECNGIRLEDVSGCELRASAECSVGCERLGIYKKACATRLHTVCRSECTVSAEVGCTDECTETCTRRCDAGENITCTHNCFRECSGNCELDCAGVDDPETCVATCEATCDGECDVSCAPLVEAGCYEHCIECCDGSCTAAANMDCQTTCQEEQFEDCEHEFAADCSASCSADGALFCDGEYILSGAELVECVQALVERGTLSAEVQAEGRAEVDLFGGDADGAAAGCSVSTAAAPADKGPGMGWSVLGLLGLAAWRRRPRR